MSRNDQGQFTAEVSDKPKIYISQESEHYYAATMPDGTTVGATSLGRMARYLRSQGYQVTQ